MRCVTPFDKCAPAHLSMSTSGLSSRSHALLVDLATRRCEFSGRWRAIKTAFAKSLPIGELRSPAMTSRGERGIWQRRYWEHTIHDDRDVAAHMDFTHFNPVKHGLVAHPAGSAAFVVSSVR
jgi:REP element-mobilizing transposase RayT